ncbi:hypothetical protein BpHYR1_044502 [Brachionus plicatilis]|uniref:Uncharacterized protein n=1 Tax=Brachionus plicatilis TaxID=10195 RepID=A0A3M7SZ94_BRAPC|nr:hypothetical protein BpHYR1_044502 [Brachionus plicatilis]
MNDNWSSWLSKSCDDKFPRESDDFCIFKEFKILINGVWKVSSKSLCLQPKKKNNIKQTNNSFILQLKLRESKSH